MNLDFQGTDAIEGIFLNISASEGSKLIEFTTKAFQMMDRLRLLKVCQDLKCDPVVKIMKCMFLLVLNFYLMSSLGWVSFEIFAIKFSRRESC